MPIKSITTMRGGGHGKSEKKNPKESTKQVKT